MNQFGAQSSYINTYNSQEPNNFTMEVSNTSRDQLLIQSLREENDNLRQQVDRLQRENQRLQMAAGGGTSYSLSTSYNNNNQVETLQREVEYWKSQHQTNNYNGSVVERSRQPNQIEQEQAAKIEELEQAIQILITEIQFYRSRDSLQGSLNAEGSENVKLRMQVQQLEQRCQQLEQDAARGSGTFYPSFRNSNESDSLLKQENEQLKRELEKYQSQVKQLVSTSISTVHTTNDHRLQQEEISRLKQRIQELEKPSIQGNSKSIFGSPEIIAKNSEIEELKRRNKLLQDEIENREPSHLHHYKEITDDQVKNRLHELENQLKLVKASKQDLEDRLIKQLSLVPLEEQVYLRDIKIKDLEMRYEILQHENDKLITQQKEQVYVYQANDETYLYKAKCHEQDLKIDSQIREIESLKTQKAELDLKVHDLNVVISNLRVEIDRYNLKTYDSRQLLLQEIQNLKQENSQLYFRRPEIIYNRDLDLEFRFDELRRQNEHLRSRGDNISRTNNEPVLIQSKLERYEPEPKKQSIQQDGPSIIQNTSYSPYRGSNYNPNNPNNPNNANNNNFLSPQYKTLASARNSNNSNRVIQQPSSQFIYPTTFYNAQRVPTQYA